LGNNVKQLKYWHETMFNHTNVRTKWCHEQMSQLLIKIVAISTKKFILRLVLYGGNHSPNSLNIMHSKHTWSLICHKGYYCLQVISKKKLKCKNTRIVIILMLNASIATRPQNPSW
jgi:hypothetical protein